MTSYHSPEAVGLEIKARVARINGTTPYETNVGRRVTLGRMHVDDTMVPMTTIIEMPDTPSRESPRGNDYKIDQRFVAFAYLECDPENPNLAAHKAKRDLKRALFRRLDGEPDRNLDGKVLRSHYLGSEIGPRADGAKYVVVAVEVGVEYVESLGE